MRVEISGFRRFDSDRSARIPSILIRVMSDYGTATSGARAAVQYACASSRKLVVRRRTLPGNLSASAQFKQTNPKAIVQSSLIQRRNVVVVEPVAFGVEGESALIAAGQAARTFDERKAA